MSSARGLKVEGFTNELTTSAKKHEIVSMPPMRSSARADSIIEGMMLKTTLYRLFHLSSLQARWLAPPLQARVWLGWRWEIPQTPLDV